MFEDDGMPNKFLVQPMTEPAKTTAVDDARKLERIFIVNHVAGPESGVLARGLLFRSIHDSKEQAEKYVVLACHNGTQRIDEFVSEAQLSEQRTTIERLHEMLTALAHVNELEMAKVAQLEQDRLKLEGELCQEREAKDMHDRHSVSLMEQRKELKAEVAQLQTTISQQATEIERLKEFEFMYKDLSK